MGLRERQASQRPKLLMCCFSVSIERQLLGVPAMLNLSKLGLLTMLKSPRTIRAVSEWAESEEKKV